MYLFSINKVVCINAFIQEATLFILNKYIPLFILNKYIPFICFKSYL